MTLLTDSVLPELIDTAVTLGDEVSPRKQNLIGLADAARVLAEHGHVSRDPRRLGQPYTTQRMVKLVRDWSQPTVPKARRFPRPWTVDGGDRRLWRREDVAEWAERWTPEPGRSISQREG